MRLPKLAFAFSITTGTVSVMTAEDGISRNLMLWLADRIKEQKSFHWPAVQEKEAMAIVQEFCESLMEKLITEDCLFYDSVLRKWTFKSPTAKPIPTDVKLPDLPSIPALSGVSIPKLDLPSIPIIEVEGIKTPGMVVEPPDLASADSEEEVSKWAESMGMDTEEFHKWAEETAMRARAEVDELNEDDDELELECGMYDDLEIEEEPLVVPTRKEAEESLRKSLKIEMDVYCILTDIETGKYAMFRHFDFQRTHSVDAPRIEADLTLRVSDRDLQEMGDHFQPGNRIHFATSDDRISMPLVIADVRIQYHAVEREHRVHLKGSTPEGVL